MEPCIAEPEKIRLKAEMSDDIADVMPYLNSVIGNAIFNKNAPLITFTKEFRLIVLYPQKLTMAKVVNQTDALQVFDWLKDLINETWANRDTITPNYEKKQKPTVPQFFMAGCPKQTVKNAEKLTVLPLQPKFFRDNSGLKTVNHYLPRNMLMPEKQLLRC